MLAGEKAILLLSLPCDHVIFVWKKRLSALKQLSASLRKPLRRNDFPTITRRRSYSFITSSSIAAKNTVTLCT